MSEERPRKRERLKEWLHENSVLLNFLVLWPTVVLTAIQTYQNSVALRNEAEQHRPRLSLRMQLEEIDNPTRFRVSMPLDVSGTTEARHVTLKASAFFDQSGQHDYLSSIEVDWESIKGRPEGDIFPAARERRFTGPILSPTGMERIRSKEESYYFIARIEYCDSQDNCYFHMNCAEVGNTQSIDPLEYCGQLSGRLEGAIARQG